MWQAHGMASHKTTLYELLSCAPGASLSDLKRAYQRAALDCHPDRSPDDVQVSFDNITIT